MRYPKETKSPERGWKSGLAFGTGNHSGGADEKVRKPIAKIGKRKKERISLGQLETSTFFTVWNSRPHACEDCGHPLREPRAHNFDHIIPKSRDASKRCHPDNIRLLCFGCHFKKTTGLNYH